MTINFTGLVRLRCNLRISFLTKYSPCLPRNGILTHILEMFSSAILLELFSEDVLLYGAESLLLCFDFNFLSIAHRKLARKPFHAINLEMVEICQLFRKNVLLHIRTARQNNDLIQAVLRDQGSKLWKLVYYPVCAVLRKTSIPDSEISKSKKCTFPFNTQTLISFQLHKNIFELRNLPVSHLIRS